jgi:hypothetical protein
VTYQLSIDQKPTYLHVIVTGDNSKENVASYLEEVFRECEDRNCPRVLVEERLEGPRLSTMDVFDLASMGGARPIPAVKAIAYVDVHAASDMMQFAETVAVNRGFPMKAFAAVAEAEEWLVRESERGV